MNKKILISFLLVVLIAISVGSVSAEDATDVIAADDDAVDVVAADEPIQPADVSVDAVQNAVNSAKEGDTVDFSNNAEYDFGNNVINIATAGITLDGKGTTTIKGNSDGKSGIFAVTAENVTIQGFNFICTHPDNDFKYNGSVNGWGVSVSNAAGGLVKDCTFKDFNSGIVVMQTNGFTIENNNFTGGYTTKLLNDPTVNKETGSKSLNIYRQSSGVTVKGNRFIGPILDGVSIAQGSGSNYVLDNYFEGNCYSIYFGGASTAGSLISGNTFVNCGFFKEGDIDWKGLPVISIQKASDDIAITDNTFKVINDNVLVAAEKGNEAHGFPTPIGNINITGNTVDKYTADVDATTVTLFSVLIRDATSLNVTSPLNISGNALEDGVKGISITFDGNEIFSATEAYLNETLDADHVYSAATLYDTTLTAKALTVYAGNNGKLQATLVDSNGVPLTNKEVAIIIDGKINGVKTDSNGVATLSVKYAAATTKYATIAFLGEGNLYRSSIATAKISVVKKATTLTAAKVKVSGKAKKVIKVKVTLKTGKTAIKGKKVTIKVNGKTFSAKTNAKGVATISVKVAKKGTFKAAFKFAGDTAYKASSSKTVKFTIKK